MKMIRGRKLLLRTLLVMGIFLTILPYFIYSTIPEDIEYRDLVTRAIIGSISSIAGGLCIVFYIWKR